MNPVKAIGDLDFPKGHGAGIFLQLGKAVVAQVWRGRILAPAAVSGDVGSSNRSPSIRITIPPVTKQLAGILKVAGRGGTGGPILGAIGAIAKVHIDATNWRRQVAYHGGV